MKKIYKYPIPIEDFFTIRMPQNANVLMVNTQKSEVFIWAIIDTDEPMIDRPFIILGTGMNVPNGFNHIGSFQMLSGGLVFHLFE